MVHSAPNIGNDSRLVWFLGKSLELGRRSYIVLRQFRSLELGMRQNEVGVQKIRPRTGTVTIPEVDNLVVTLVLTQTLCSELKRSKTCKTRRDQPK